MEKAFKKAIIQGGYAMPMGIGGYCKPEEVFMDKNFWIALGKALGKDKKYFCIDCGGNYKVESGCENREENGCSYGQKWWLYMWHEFIDNLARGKDAESFFKRLLK